MNPEPAPAAGVMPGQKPQPLRATKKTQLTITEDYPGEFSWEIENPRFYIQARFYFDNAKGAKCSAIHSARKLGLVIHETKLVLHKP